MKIKIEVLLLMAATIQDWVDMLSQNPTELSAADVVTTRHFIYHLQMATNAAIKNGWITPTRV